MFQLRTVFAVAALALFSIAASAEEPTGDQLVDGLNGVFGKHAGTRGSHAKGQCVKGTFTPTADAPSLSTAAFLAKPVPVLGRFSFGGGDPKAKEKAKTPRGLAMRLDPAGGEPIDLVQLSVPVFFAKNPEQALGFLKAREGAGVGKPDAEKIKAFTAANPETARQQAAIDAGPIPASYAQLNYFSIHAFLAKNKDGVEAKVKLKTVPKAGIAGLTKEEADAKPDDFFTADLKEKLAAGPIGFTLVATIGEAGDPTNDPTVDWPAGRKEIMLGDIAITAIEDNAQCDATTFDPNNLGKGFAGAPDDTVLPARATSYASSLSRRSQ
jgi:catalase